MLPIGGIRRHRHRPGCQAGEKPPLVLAVGFYPAVILLLYPPPVQQPDTNPDDRIGKHSPFHQANQHAHGFTSPCCDSDRTSCNHRLFFPDSACPSLGPEWRWIALG